MASDEELVGAQDEVVNHAPPWDEPEEEKEKIKQEKPITVELTLKSRLKGRIRAKVERVTVMIDHPFGVTQYNMRKAQSFLNVSPTGLTLEATLPEGAGLDDFVAAIVNSQVLACEVVVAEAVGREEVKKEEREAEIMARVEEAKRKEREVIKRAAEEMANRTQVQTF